MKKIFFIISILVICSVTFAGQTNAATSIKSKVKRCGKDKDWQCLMAASESCQKATLTTKSTVNFFGFLQTSTLRREIKRREKNGERCKYYIKVRFDEESKQKLRDGGITNEGIKQTEKEAENSRKSLLSVNGQCLVEPAELTRLLTNWSQGNLETDDYKRLQECKGSLFQGVVGSSLN